VNVSKRHHSIIRMNSVWSVCMSMLHLYSKTETVHP